MGLGEELCLIIYGVVIVICVAILMRVGPPYPWRARLRGGTRRGSSSTPDARLNQRPPLLPCRSITCRQPPAAPAQARGEPGAEPAAQA